MSERIVVGPDNRLYVDLSVAPTPGGRVGDTSSLARPGYKGKRRTTDYERQIAHALMRKRGMSKGRAIAMARGLLNKAAATGRWGRRGKASGPVRAGAAASIAQRASFSTPVGKPVDLAHSDTTPAAARIALAERKRRQAAKKPRRAMPNTDLAWSPNLHPRDWRGRFAVKNALAGPLDEKGRVLASSHEAKLYDAHVKEADATIIREMNRLSTHNDGVNGRVVKGPDGKDVIEWSPERAKLQREIVSTVYKREARRAKAERKALFLGGPPGAGKSTQLGKIDGLNQRDYVTINPDLFKEELARRGLVPEAPSLTPMEASAFVHEESSMMALMLAARAQRAGKNIIWDITMSKASSVESRMKPLREAGYRQQAVFVDIPFEMSQQRVEQRHRSGHLAYTRDTTGNHMGQRLVPSSHVGGGKSKKGSSSAYRDAFDEVKNSFSAYQLIDNSGTDGGKLHEARGKLKW